MAGPVEGVKVVELGVWVAGPAAGGILADWGADVIKIEPPTGDPARMFGRMLGCDMGLNPPFEMDNRSKRSVVLNLGTDAGRATAFELLAGADVFLTNVRPGALQRLGLDFESVSAANPAWSTGSSPGMAKTGRTPIAPPSTWPRSGPGPGWPTCSPGPARRPVSAWWHGRPLRGDDDGRGRVRGAARARTHRGGPTGDHLAVPAGRLHRELRPEHLPDERAADRDRATRVDGQPVHEQLRRPRRAAVLDRRPGARAALAGPVPRRGRPEWRDDPRFADARSRAANSAALIVALDEIFATRPLDEWAQIFAGEPDFFWSPVNTLEDVVADEQFHAAGGIVDVPDGDAAVPMVATPADFHGTPWAPRSAAPELGQHTEEVLADLEARRGS